MIKKRILILGANGFIGYHLSKYLLETKAYSLTLFSRTISTHLAVLGNSPDVKLIQGDFTDKQLLSKVIEGQNFVYHLISETFPANSWDAPMADVNKNLIPTLQLLELASEVKINKFIFISSGGTVYGSHTDIINENTLPKPYSPHGIIKLCIEHFLEYFYQNKGLVYDVYRVSNPYGPMQQNKGLGVITTWLNQILEDKEIVIYGEGKNTRDYIYIEDVINLIALSLTSEISIPNIYNICSGKSYSLLELTKIVEMVVQKPININFKKNRKSDNSQIFLDNTKIMKKVPGYQFISLIDGIKYTWEYIKKSS